MLIIPTPPIRTHRRLKFTWGPWTVNKQININNIINIHNRPSKWHIQRAQTHEMFVHQTWLETSSTHVSEVYNNLRQHCILCTWKTLSSSQLIPTGICEYDVGIESGTFDSGSVMIIINICITKGAILHSLRTGWLLGVVWGEWCGEDRDSGGD